MNGLFFIRSIWLQVTVPVIALLGIAACAGTIYRQLSIESQLRRT